MIRALLRARWLRARWLRAGLVGALLWAAPADTALDEQLWRLRNLGKAFYENPTTQQQAVEQFKKALDLAPNSARERLNYALALLRAGKTDQGVEELLRVQKQDPSLPHTWFNLGVVYRKNGEVEKGIPQFEKMTQLVPDEPVSHYNLGALFRQEGQLERAQNQFLIATRLNPNLAAPHFQLYNVYRQLGAPDKAAQELAIFQRLKKEQENAVIAEDMEWSDYAEIYDPIDIEDSTLPPELTRVALPPDASGQLRLGADETLRWSKYGIVISSHGKAVQGTGLEGLKGVIDVAAGDFDNDGLPDLCVLTEQGPLLFRNSNGHFLRNEANLPAGRFEQAVWLDYDHDYDLDLFLLGEHSMLFRNQGSAGFADHTADFPFQPGHAIDGMLYRVQADSKAFDFVVTYQDHPGILYADKLGGQFEPKPIPELPAGARWLRAADVNHDSRLDIVASTGTLLNRRGQFEAKPEPVGDGSLPGGAPAGSNWITVGLTGVKNLKLAYGAEVEVKAGASYQKKIYEGIPLTFALGKRTEVDTVRITWPNGLIQNEPKQAVNRAYAYKEAQRLSGSCPMIWTWDGSGFEFITDVLGVAPLGASSGDGQYFATDHDEYISIPGRAFGKAGATPQIRITEELSEVSYLDQVQLMAVDHPAGTEIYTSEKWKGPPFPEFRLYGVRRRLYPKTARDDNGNNVLAKLLARDRTYPDTQLLDLDFGPGAALQNKAILVLNGWVDWADGSRLWRRRRQARGWLRRTLQVRNKRGEWQTVIEDMGMPDGKPKTIVVDLTGKFLSASREVRIVTNLCVYWDEIFLSESNAQPPARLTRLPTAGAEVGFRGFSPSKIDPWRKQPEQFFYAPASPASYWNPTPGLYTRYGDVKALVESPDDRFVIMGSGDELRMQFDARGLPPLPRAWTRDFILKVDGWAKDRDANTAYSQSVEPLPFHAMSRYPYGAGERYPDDAAHEQYRKEYNTRPALVLIRPLVAGR